MRSNNEITIPSLIGNLIVVFRDPTHINIGTEALVRNPYGYYYGQSPVQRKVIGKFGFEALGAKASFRPSGNWLVSKISIKTYEFRSSGITGYSYQRFQSVHPEAEVVAKIQLLLTSALSKWWSKERTKVLLRIHAQEKKELMQNLKSLQKKLKAEENQLALLPPPLEETIAKKGERSALNDLLKANSS